MKLFFIRTALLLFSALLPNAAIADEITDKLLLRARQAVNNGDAEEALERYQTLVKLYPTGEPASEAWWQIARICEHLEEPQPAFDALQKLITGFPGHFERAHAGQMQLVTRMIQGEDRRARLTAQEKKKKPDETMRDTISAMLQTIYKNGPQSDVGARAHHTLALFLERNGELAAAHAMHEDFIEEHPNHELADDSACQMAYIRYKEWKTMRGEAPRHRQTAQDALNWFLSRYPQSERAALAYTCLKEMLIAETRELESIARFYESQGKQDAARIYREQLAKKLEALQPKSAE